MEKRTDQILVIGAGIAGLTAALDLAGMGRPSLVVEKQGRIGGHGGRHACKAVNGQCQKCGACLVDDAVARTMEMPEIELAMDSDIIAIEKKDNRFYVRIRHQGQESERSFRAVLLCHGFIPFDPRLKPNLGYGDIPNLITGLALEQMLKKRGEAVRPSDLKKPGRIAFVQCVGSRDERLGRPYCSQVCCGYALRMARKIKASNPEAEITFFYMDIQSFSRDFRDIWRRIQEDMRFIPEIPGDYRRAEGDRIAVSAEYDNKIRDFVFDLMVLSVGMSPSPDQGGMEDRLDLEFGPEGFLLPYQSPGVMALGSATGPMGIVESITHAHACVNELLDHLGSAG